VSEKIPWYKIGRMSGGNPFSSLGLDWCQWCKMEVDTDTDAGHDSDVYVYRRRCQRCGRVIKFGACRAPLISAKPLPAVALSWVVDPGKDRR
jgi:hypothetical protein